MGVSRDRFDQGITYQQFKDAMTVNRDQLEANERNLQLTPEEMQPFQSLPGTVNVLAIAADWCGDVVANLPILGRLAQECDKLNLRVFPKDQNMDLMNQYLNKGLYQSIPVFVFFDDAFKQLGVFIERSAAVSELREQRRRALHAEHPEFGAPEGSPNELPDEVRQRLRGAIGQMRIDTKEFADHAVVHELGEIASRSAETAQVPSK
ncbi:MAG TPA: thioredoxin family protein [Chloroflexota bacterium]|jgi:thiol-disulfide isomerase/thioredoxin